MFFLKFIKSLFLSIFQVEKKYDFKSNYSIRAYWELKKRRIRFFFAVFLVAFNLLGIELSTPHYSLTSEFAGILCTQIDFFSTIAKKISAPKNLLANDNVSQPIEPNVSEVLKKIRFGNTIKWFAYSVFVFTFIFAFINADPYSRKDLLIEIVENGKYRKWEKLPNLRDVKGYAQIVPSNVLYFRCKECEREESCKNSLVNKGYKRNDIWNKIFIAVNPETVNANLDLVNQCRKWHFLKYSLLVSGIFLTIVFFIVRCFEYFLLNLTVVNNWQLLILIVGTLIAFLVLDKLDPSLNKLDAHLKVFYYSPEFRILCKQKHCLCKEPEEIYDPKKLSDSDGFLGETEKVMIKSYEKEIQRLKMTIDYFALTNMHRIDKLVDTIAKGQIRRKPLIRTILSSIAFLFNELYNDGTLFTVSLLVPVGETLTTWISQTNNESINYPMDEIGCDIDRGEVFGLRGKSVASKCWRNNKPLSSDKHICYIYKNQEEVLKSIIAIPIECTEKLYLKINESQYAVDKVVGILCVTSTNPNTFTRKSCDANTTMLTPFVSMINLQYSLRAIEKLNL